VGAFRKEGILKYISTFSGIEAASAAWEPIGWEPLAFCEIDEFPSAVLARHYPDVPNLGDITKVDWERVINEYGRPDVVVGGSPCFTAGTLVLCESGFKPIEEVEVGEKVVTHKGNLKRVLNVGSKISDTIILKGQGSVGIECTPNHPFYSREKHKIWDNAKREYLMVYDKSSEWRNAESMKGKFWLNVCDVKKTPIPQFSEHGKGKRGKGYVKDFTFNENFFYFVGRWLGDGWANAHKRKGREESLMKRVCVCCSHDESNDLEDRLLSTGLHFGKSDSKSTVRFTCSSTQLYDWLVGNFGVHADGKNMPAWCFGMSEKFRASMLSGYLDADGTKVRNGYKSTTINRSLSLGIKMLAGSLGMASSVTLNVNHRDATIEGRKVNERPNYVSSHYANSHSAFFADSGYYGLVRNVADARKNVTVYNLEVEDDNSYTADGIAVHNCQSFSIAGGRESLRGESALCFEYWRAIRDIRPTWFLWENVPGVLNTRDNAFGQFLWKLEELGYGMAWRVLDAQFFGVAQRRRRVFLVGHLGSGGGAGAVLFESESVRGNTQTSKQKREELTRAAGRGAAAGGSAGNCLTPWDVQSKRIFTESGAAPTLNSGDREGGGIQPSVLQAVALQTDHTAGNGSGINTDDVSYTVSTSMDQAVAFAQNTRDEVRIVGALAASPGVKQQSYVCQAFSGGSGGDTNMGLSDDCSPTITVRQPVDVMHEAAMTQYGAEVAGKLTARSDSSPCSDRGQNIVCMAHTHTNAEIGMNLSPTLTVHASKDAPVLFASNGDEVVGEGTADEMAVTIHDGSRWVVRRLMPVECERLQGFPDHYTDIPYKGKEHPPNTPRYKALGNSMAVPVMRWIGERMQMVDSIINELSEEK